MNHIDDGGPAFPIPNPDGETFSPKTVKDLRRLMSGMSLRDYFAAKALNGLLAQFQGVANGIDPIHHATWSYEMADAMLAAREANK